MNFTFENRLISYASEIEISTQKNFDISTSHLILVVFGRLRCVVSDAEREISARSCLFIPKGFSVSVSPLDTEYTVITTLSFDADLFSLGRRVMPMPTDPVYISKREECIIIASTLERLSLAETLSREATLYYSELIARELLLFISSYGSEPRNISDSMLGQRVERYLSEHIDSYVGLDELAGRFFVSKYYLCRAFKKHSGVTVHAFVNERRLSLARELILCGEGALSVSYKVGFSDYSAFYRAYVKRYGTPPSQRGEKGACDGV